MSVFRWHNCVDMKNSILEEKFNRKCLFFLTSYAPQAFFFYGSSTKVRIYGSSIP